MQHDPTKSDQHTTPGQNGLTAHEQLSLDTAGPARPISEAQAAFIRFSLVLGNNLDFVDGKIDRFLRFSPSGSYGKPDLADRLSRFLSLDNNRAEIQYNEERDLVHDAADRISTIRENLNDLDKFDIQLPDHLQINQKEISLSKVLEELKGFATILSEQAQFTLERDDLHSKLDPQCEGMRNSLATLRSFLDRVSIDLIGRTLAEPSP